MKPYKNDSNETRLAVLENIVYDTKETLNKIEKRFDKIDEKFSKLDEKLENINEKIDSSFKWSITTILGLYGIIVLTVALPIFLKLFHYIQ